MEFFNTITESNILNKSITGTSKYSAKDFANILFAYFCAIRILKSEFYGASSLSNYLSKTSLQVNGSLKGNDIDTLLNILFSDKALKSIKFRDQQESEHFIKSLTINMPTVRTFINQSIKGQQNIEFDRRFLLYAENQLKVNDSILMAIRRLSGEWEMESDADKVLVFTRLIQYFRSMVKKADILPILEAVAKKTNLEDKDIDKRQAEEPQKEKKNKTDMGKAIGAGIGSYYGSKHIGKGLAK